MVEHRHEATLPSDGAQGRLTRVLASAVAVLAAFATAVVVLNHPPAEPKALPAAIPVMQWPVRGTMAQDRALLAAAEQTWRTEGGPTAPVGDVHPIYAQRMAIGSANLIVIALAAADSAGREHVAFVTTPIARSAPDPAHLLLRAVTPVEPQQLAVGFMAACPAPQDSAIIGGGGVGFALGAPGVPSVRFTSSMLDQLLDERGRAQFAAWWVFPTGVGAWNSTITASNEDGGQPVTVRVTAGTHDPVTRPLTLGARTLIAPGVGRAGDLVVTAEGVIGVIGADGLVDTRLSSLGSRGRVVIAISRIPGKLVEVQDGAVRFEPTAPGEVASGNRVVLVHPTCPQVLMNIGRLRGTANGWQVDRAAAPDAGEPAMTVAVG